MDPCKKNDNDSAYGKTTEKVGKKKKTDLLMQVWDKKVPDTELEKFKQVVEKKYNLKFDTFWDFRMWSVQNFIDYWKVVWDYFGVIASKPYDEVFVKTGPKFLNVEWFKGAKMNYAENLLRIRDDREAILYADEEGAFEKMTFVQLFDEVKLYAAAFRANGLRIGDRVACYMSNRIEAVIAYLATLSIGAIWGGPIPFYRAKASMDLIGKIEAKILIAVDRYQFDGKEFDLLQYLPDIAQNVTSLEKVIIFGTKESTYAKDISNIRNSCFLRDFLETGRLPDGSVPDLVFEQLPLSQPIMISFTSGSTGLPKGSVHAASCLLSHIAENSFYYNLKSGDTNLNLYPSGWTLMTEMVPCLALGARLLLFAGASFYTGGGINLWDLLAEHHVTHVFFVTSDIDRMQKLDVVPSPHSKFDYLKMITVGGSAVKSVNYRYIFNKIKKDVFMGNLYGGTEVNGSFAGFNLNLPVYQGEVQTTVLGYDIKCFNPKGESVIGERGEMVMCNPCPGLLLRLWKDHDGKILEATYFSKFPGVYAQNDEIEINPQTNGLKVIGRSDDKIVQNGDCFTANDIYLAIQDMEEIEDYICVSQSKWDDTRAILFLKMRKGFPFTPQFRHKVADQIEAELFHDSVPQLILSVQDIPYNMNRKRMESVVRKIVATNVIPEIENIRNKDSLKYYCDIPEIVNYDKL